MDAATAALIGAGVGVVGGGIFGVATALITARLQRAMAREARREERLARAYLDVSGFLVRIRGLMRTAVADLRAPVDLGGQVIALGVQASAIVFLYGSLPVKRGYWTFTVAAAAFTDAMNEQPIAPEKLSAALDQVDESVTTLLDLLSEDLGR